MVTRSWPSQHVLSCTPAEAAASPGGRVEKLSALDDDQVGRRVDPPRQRARGHQDLRTSKRLTSRAGTLQPPYKSQQQGLAPEPSCSQILSSQQQGLPPGLLCQHLIQQPATNSSAG